MNFFYFNIVDRHSPFSATICFDENQDRSLLKQQLHENFLSRKTKLRVMSFCTEKTIGSLETVSLSASILHGLERIKQMAVLVLRGGIQIVQCEIIASPINIQNHNAGEPRQASEKLFYERQLLFTLLVVTDDLSDPEEVSKVWASVVVTSKVQPGDDTSGSQSKWTISQDQNFIRIDDGEVYCIEFADMRPVLQEYRPRMKECEQEIPEERVLRFMRH